MSKVFILGGMRTPIVVAGTKFKYMRPEIFGAEVLKALREKFSLIHVDEIICGNAVGTGDNIARLMTLCAGFDDSTAALTSTDNVQAVRQQFQSATRKFLAGLPM